MLKAKKIIANILIVLVALLTSMLFSFIIIVNENANHSLEVNQQANIEGVASTESLEAAKQKYKECIMATLAYDKGVEDLFKSYRVVESEKYVNLFGKPTAAKVYEKVDIVEYTEEDTYYTISSQEEYEAFVNLTHEYEEVLVDTDITGKPNGGVHVDMYYQNAFHYRFKEDYANITTPKKITVYDDAECKVKCDGYFFLPDLNDTQKLEAFQMKVRLTRDIEVELTDSKKNDNDDIRQFYGIFDGCGHTIKFKGKDRFVPDKAMGVFVEENKVYIYSPFCSYLGKGGEIKNVEVDYSDCGYLLLDKKATTINSYAAGLVGHNEGTIVSCIVNSPKVDSNRYRENAYYGAISAINNGLIQHCMVEGKFEIQSQDWNLGDPDGINVYWSCVPYDTDGKTLSSGTPLYCVFNAEVIERKPESDDKDFILSPFDVGKTADGKNQLSYENEHNYSYDIFNGGKPNVPISFNLSSISSNGGKEGTYWYFAHGYNGDVPYLRIFLNWKTIYFESEDTSKGEVDPGSIEVPLNASIGGDKGGYSQIIILDQIIDAWCESGWVISSWTWKEDSNKYIVNFTEHYAYFKFDPKLMNDSGVGFKITGISTDHIYRVPYNTKVSVKIVYYSHNAGNRVKYIEYIFDSDLEYHLGGWRHYLGGRSIKFESKSEAYYISLSTVLGRTEYEDFEIINDSYGDPKVILMALTLHRKDYDIAVK